MPSLAENIAALATRAGQECKLLHDEIGDITTLTTTNKDSLTKSINSLVVDIGVIPRINDDAVSTGSLYSSSKIVSVVTDATTNLKDDLLNGAGEAYDTLKELQDLIIANGLSIDALEALAAGHVHFDKAQTLTTEQKERARTNIDAVSTAQLSEKASELVDMINNGGDALDAHITVFEAFKEAVGNTGTDFVQYFEEALVG